MDVPVLESILSVPYDLPELLEAPQPFVLENDFTPRKIQPRKMDFRGPVAEIPWVRAASMCLGGLHPAGIASLWSVQASKVLCYKSVVERFSCSAESLIPGEYFSICIPIVKMLTNELRSQALNALQLLMFHLPWKRRQQLQHLLNFLHLVVEDIFVSVDKKVRIIFPLKFCCIPLQNFYLFYLIQCSCTLEMIIIKKLVKFFCEMD